jgi:hypothetical protein
MCGLHVRGLVASISWTGICLFDLWLSEYILYEASDYELNV